VTFNKTTHPHDAFECAGDKEMEENIFVDEEL
jgi:GTP1/Obg family GTP-binding protein